MRIFSLKPFVELYLTSVPSPRTVYTCNISVFSLIGLTKFVTPYKESSPRLQPNLVKAVGRPTLYTACSP